MNRILCKQYLLLLICMALLLPGQLPAQNGLYVGTDLGIAIAPGMSVAGSDNDWGTKCDRIINPQELEVGNDCATHPPPSAWSNEFSGGTGILTGVALGYDWGKVRAEFEYFYRTTTYNDRTGARVGDEVSLGKIDQEIETVEGGLDDVLSHNFFGNLYYDFTSKSRFTPYVGIGMGVTQASMDYSSRWKRNDNPDFITTFMDPALNAKLAGTTTIGTAKLSDRVLGYQVLGGGDYKVNDSISVGIKFRWADFAEFMDGAEWDQLRSHDSTNNREDLVIYTATTSDIQFWAISFNLKFHFDR